jgi:hypothetical protein
VKGSLNLDLVEKSRYRLDERDQLDPRGNNKHSPATHELGLGFSFLKEEAGSRKHSISFAVALTSALSAMGVCQSRPTLAP